MRINRINLWTSRYVALQRSGISIGAVEIERRNTPRTANTLVLGDSARNPCGANFWNHCLKINKALCGQYYLIHQILNSLFYLSCFIKGGNACAAGCMSPDNAVCECCLPRRALLENRGLLFLHSARFLQYCRPCAGGCY